MPASRRVSSSVAFLLCLSAGIACSAQTESVLHSFCRQGAATCSDAASDGATPNSGLVQGSDGFYGTTESGGAYNLGSAFKITSSGTFTLLHSFCSSSNCPDGSEPSAPLLLASDGNFYGTTEAGGAYSSGTIFKMTPSGTVTTLYTFCSTGGVNCTDGDEPYAGLIQGTDGLLYGTTEAGGANNGGTAFNITLAGKLTVLHSFCAAANCSDGYLPLGGVVQGSDGFYGTTSQGGTSYLGTVYKVTSSGVFTSLYSFCSEGGTLCTDGVHPYGGLVQGTDGNFYGATSTGGVYSQSTLFRITPSGGLTTLYTFADSGNCINGNGIIADLIKGSDGNFYGTTSSGGLHGYGTVFRATPAGAVTTLYSFCAQGASSCTDGELPRSRLLQGTDGDFYGTTGSGGANGGGVVFKLTAPKTAPPTFSTTLSASPNPASSGQQVTFQATVTGSGGTATGSVNFSSSGLSLGNATLNSSGVASLSASSQGIATGSYPVIAAYSGNSTYGCSNSPSLVVKVVPAPTTTTLTSISPNPVTPPANATLTATVRRSATGAGGNPGGTVSFFADTYFLGTANLSSGTATLQTSTKGVVAGSYSISATYNGDSFDSTSTSSPVSVTVK